jgi:Flp pilus assembly protein TadD
MPQRRYILTLACLFAAGCLESQERRVSDEIEPSQAQRAEAKAAPAPRISPDTHLAAGHMLEKQGDVRGAIEQYEKAIAASPRSIAAYNRLGILYQRMAKFEDAERIFTRGLESQPSSPVLLNNLGYNCLSQRNYKDAEEYFRQALRTSPGFKRARMNLAIALTQTKRIEAGLQQFKQVVPEDVAYGNVAVICSNAGDYIGAEAALRKSLALNPDCLEAKRLLDEVVQLAKSSKPPSGHIPNAALAGSPEESPPE